MRGGFKLGRYVAGDSWVHRLDPRSKVIAMLLYFGAILLVDSVMALFALAAVSFPIMAATGIPLRVYVRTLKPLRFLIAFMFIIPILLENRGIAPGVLAAGRMTLFIMFTALLTFTTDTKRLIQGLESLLSPLRRLGADPGRWTFMLSVALRFIPSIVEEADVILKAQASRGADFQSQSWPNKAKSLVTLLVPVTASAFRRATDLIDAYASRGYRPGAPRTYFYTLAWTRQDTWFVIGSTAILLLTAAWQAAPMAAALWYGG